MRRLQQACGLSCDAKYSIDGDEIMVCVRADTGDLRTEADRQNYKLQCRNQPFKPLPQAAIHEVDFLPLFESANPEGNLPQEIVAVRSAGPRLT